MRLIVDYTGGVHDFVQARTGQTHRFGAHQAFGVIDQAGVLAAGWLFHDWNPEAGTIEFSGASVRPGWMTRAILHNLFAYAFDGVGCQMVVTRNRADNTRLHRQLCAFGFDRIDVPRLFGRTEDGVFWMLTDDQWRSGRFYIKGDGDETRRAEAA